MPKLWCVDAARSNTCKGKAASTKQVVRPSLIGLSDLALRPLTLLRKLYRIINFMGIPSSTLGNKTGIAPGGKTFTSLFHLNFLSPVWVFAIASSRILHP